MSGLGLFFKRRKLRNALLGDDPEARSSAAEQLVNLGWEPTTPEERAACLVGDWKLEEAAALGAVAVRFLGQSMVKANPGTRIKIADILGKLGSPKAVPYLIIEKCKDADIEEHQSVALGTDCRINDSEIVGSALVYKTKVLHLTVFAKGESDKTGRSRSRILRMSQRRSHY